MTHVDHGPAAGLLMTARKSGTLFVTLNRPQHANSLNEQLMGELQTLWKQTADDKDLRCIVITGSGRFFCAGADAKMLASARTAVGATAAEELAFLPGDHVDVPVIVAVNGTCAGGGLHFVADADIVVAGESASFLDPHVSIGQVSGIEPIELMSTMRRDAVIRMALLGTHEKLSAAAAHKAGLVSEVVPDADLLERAGELAAQIATGSPEAIRLTRRAYRSYINEQQREHLDLGWRMVQEHWAHSDSKEGPTAFSEKREPRWSNR
ncbi:MAG: enoyl-CoA hydratase/isomerase family protein [Cryobacterium sp.]|nr:enoyl-CoA hydratase/isomerase family protein [Cryobacterium sp.]